MKAAPSTGGRRPTRRGVFGAVAGIVVALVLGALLAVEAGHGAASQTAPAAASRARLPSHTPANPRRTGPAGGARFAASVARPRGEPTHSGPAVNGGPPPSLPRPVPGWTFTRHAIAAGGLDRYYLVARRSAPANAAPVPARSLPVLVVLHGRLMTPANMVAASAFLPTVGDAIVVYPAGYDRSWNAGYCCGQANAAGVDDVAFLRAVVAQTVADQPGADPGRVYLAGFSNGGRMAYRMACASPGTFAGVAAVEAVAVSACPDTTPEPVVIVANSGDPLLTIGLRSPPKRIDGHTEPTVDAEAASWRRLDGCSGPPRVVSTGALTTQTWTACRGRGRVEVALYAVGGHRWFAGCQATPPAQAVVWDAFQGRRVPPPTRASTCPPQPHAGPSQPHPPTPPR